MSEAKPDRGYVYVVDDDPAVGRTVARTAEAAGFSSRLFGSPCEFLEALDELGPGCVCLDIGMPGMNGVELLKLLSVKRPELPVIMLTGHAEVGSAVDSFRSGALNFLRKPFNQAELVGAFEEAAEVARRRQIEAVDSKQLMALDTLSQRERQVLDEIAQGMQSKQIAWKLGISVRTVDVHRAKILTKLSAKNTSQAVAIARAASPRGFG